MAKKNKKKPISIIALAGLAVIMSAMALMISNVNRSTTPNQSYAREVLNIYP